MSDPFVIEMDEIIAVMQKDLDRHYDVCFVVDADIHFRQGWVGQGKSNLLLTIALRMNHNFWPLRDMSVKDDYHKFFLLLHRKFPMSCNIFDELLPFFNRQAWSKPFISTTTVDFMLNRKDFKIWGGAVPSIWRLVPTFYEHRMQMLFRVRNRTEVEVYEHNGKFNEREDWWGKYLTTLENVPFIGDEIPRLWGLYEWMNDAHPRIHSPDNGCAQGLMGLPYWRTWKYINSYWKEVETGTLEVPSIDKRSRRLENQRKVRDERVIKVKDLHSKGISMGKIAKELGISPATVHKDYHTFIQEPIVDTIGSQKGRTNDSKKKREVYSPLYWRDRK